MAVLYMGQPSKRILPKLDPIHHRGLRVALGAFRTSVSSLYAKAEEMTLKNRPPQKKQKKLSI